MYSEELAGIRRVLGVRQRTDADPVTELGERLMAESATGVRIAGHYREQARRMGYPHLVSWDMSSSSGDWSFLVSENGRQWHWMHQTNNFPRDGFSYTVDPMIMEGDIEDVMRDIAHAEA